MALTDQQGNITDTAEYTAFGELAPGYNALPTPFGYCGRVGYYFDGELGKFHVRRRDYDPVRSRWLALDPLGIRAGQMGMSTP